MCVFYQKNEKMIKLVVSPEFNLVVAAYSPAVNTHSPTDCSNTKKLFTAASVSVCFIWLSQYSCMPIILRNIPWLVLVMNTPFVPCEVWTTTVDNCRYKSPVMTQEAIRQHLTNEVRAVAQLFCAGFMVDKPGNGRSFQRVLLLFLQ